MTSALGGGFLRRSLVDEHLPPFGVARAGQLTAIRRMATEQSQGATLIFGHDPEQWELIAEHGLAAAAGL